MKPSEVRGHQRNVARTYVDVLEYFAEDFHDRRAARLLRWSESVSERVGRGGESLRCDVGRNEVHLYLKPLVTSQIKSEKDLLNNI